MWFFDNWCDKWIILHIWITFQVVPVNILVLELIGGITSTHLITSQLMLGSVWIDLTFRIGKKKEIFSTIEKRGKLYPSI